MEADREMTSEERATFRDAAARLTAATEALISVSDPVGAVWSLAHQAGLLIGYYYCNGFPGGIEQGRKDAIEVLDRAIAEVRKRQAAAAPNHEPHSTVN